MGQIVSSGIIDFCFEKSKSNLSVDVAIVGGGPPGIMAAYFLVKVDKKVALFDRKLAPGGGMRGGAMMFNDTVVQEETIPIIKELGISHEGGANGTYTMDSVHTTSVLIYQAAKAGATIFNCYSVEDVVLHNDAIAGAVMNWAPVIREGIHVDPLTVMTKAILEGMGHDCEIARVVACKNNIQLSTPTRGVIGERPLNAELGRQTTVENTKEICPGLLVSGMAANGVNGSFRMGLISGDILMSGKKAVELVCEKLGN